MRVTFTRDEWVLMAQLAQGLDPEKYVSSRAKALIYKLKSVEDGDTIYLSAR